MSATPDRQAVLPPAADQRRAGAGGVGLAVTLRSMRRDDLAEVEALERQVYSHPWTRGNFQDSLDSGYHCWIARASDGQLTGYFLLMQMPDEAHLLNITVASSWQGRGLGRLLLDRAGRIAGDFAAPAMLLEVRPSNPHALAVYRHVGFHQIGLRKNYYPASNGQREDAIVMRLAL